VYFNKFEYTRIQKYSQIDNRVHRNKSICFVFFLLKIREKRVENFAISKDGIQQQKRNKVAQKVRYSTFF